LISVDLSLGVDYYSISSCNLFVSMGINYHIWDFSEILKFTHLRIWDREEGNMRKHN